MATDITIDAIRGGLAARLGGPAEYPWFGCADDAALLASYRASKLANERYLDRELSADETLDIMAFS